MAVIGVIPQKSAARADPLSLVTHEIVDAFERDGAVWIPGLLSASWMDLIAHGVQRNLNNPGPHLIKHFAGEPGEYHDDFGNYLVVPEYQRRAGGLADRRRDGQGTAEPRSCGYSWIRFSSRRAATAAALPGIRTSPG